MIYIKKYIDRPGAARFQRVNSIEDRSSKKRVHTRLEIKRRRHGCGQIRDAWPKSYVGGEFSMKGICNIYASINKEEL